MRAKNKGLSVSVFEYLGELRAMQLRSKQMGSSIDVLVWVWADSAIQTGLALSLLQKTTRILKWIVLTAVAIRFAHEFDLIKVDLIYFWN